MTDRLLFFALSLAMLVSSSAVAQKEHEQDQPSDIVERTFNIGPKGTLDISNLSGSIVIVGVGGEEIRVKADRQSEDEGPKNIAIDASQTPGRVEIRTLFGRHKNKAEVDYTVEVPFDTSVLARSLSGDIQVVKVRGELQLETTNGNIEATGTPRLVRLKSFSGSVVVTDAGAPDGLSASTVSGDLMIKSLKARGVDLVTVSGDLSLLNTWCERAQLRTVNGDVEFSGGIARGGRYEFNSHSGDISLHLAGNQGFELSATTFSGEVHTGLPPNMVTKPDPNLPEGVPHSQDVRGTFGDGGALLLVKTFSGDVSVDRAEGGKPVPKKKQE
jgi:DUF4097 and DUF4098 domain-containing protein YvlB